MPKIKSTQKIKEPKKSLEPDYSKLEILAARDNPDTLRKLALQVHISHEQVRKHLKSRNLYAEYQKRRKLNTVSGEREVYATIYLGIESQITASAKDNWAEEQAVEFIKSTSRMGTTDTFRTWGTLPTLITLFQRYKHAQDNQEMTSLKALGKGLFKVPNYLMMVSGILKRMGLSTNLGETPKYKRDAVIRVVKLDASIDEVSYFSSVSKSSVAYIRRTTTSNTSRAEGRNKALVGGTFKFLDLSKASQMYEWLDTGYTAQVTARELKMGIGMVEVAIIQSERYRPKIIKLIQTLYDTEEITTPYISNKQKKDHWKRLELLK
jgi:hypothetical protein